MYKTITMLKKSLFVLTALFIMLSCTIGQSKIDTGSLLWKISGNGLEEASFLFGTHHLVPTGFLDSVPGLYSAFEQTEQTVGELDMSKMAEMQVKILSESTLPKGVTYDSLLSQDDVALLDSTLKNLIGAGLNQFGTLKPALIANIISITLYRQFYPSLSDEISMDQYFQEEAFKSMKPIIGLESTEDQINIMLNSQSLERQAELLICMVKNPDLLKEQMDELQVAYHAHDISTLFELSEKVLPDDPCPSTEEEEDAINKNRNEKWLVKLPAIMADKPSFIAVGCLHLPGEIGLIEGLRKLGYTVEPIS